MPKSSCSIDGCENSHKAHGWCNKHYRRWKRQGDPLALSRAEPEFFLTLEEAFIARTEWSNGCLVWIGGKGKDGYGQFSVNGAKKAAHRYAWERDNGLIPSGMVVNHMCWNPCCVNIDHLKVVSYSENSSYRKGAQANNHSSGIRNVVKVGDKWSVRVVKGGVGHYFGDYSTPEEATKVAERARQEMFGGFAGRG